MNSRWQKRNGHWEYIAESDGAVHDLTDFATSRRPEAETGDCWGEWVVASEPRQLVHKAHNYAVPVDEIRTNQHLVDWLAQLLSKNWMTPSSIGDFLTAFDYIRDLRQLER